MQTQLNQIETCWSLVDLAHAEQTAAESARCELLERYYGAAWRYLLAMTRDESLAEDLFQEFALRLIRGDFCRAAPQAGRFRDYLKTVLVNLVKDECRSRVQRPCSLAGEIADPVGDPLADSASHETFLESWREELLHRAWQALEETHAGLYAVLRLHAAQPDATAGEKARYLSRALDEPFTPNRFRVMLHRARQKFAALLRREVAVSMGEPDEETLRSELRQLRLLQYCSE